MQHSIPTAAEIERRQAMTEQAMSRRRNMQRAVSDVREQITSSSGLKRVFEVELVRLFAKNHISGLIVLVPFTLLTALATLHWSDLPRTLAWLICTLTVLGAQYWICQAYMKCDQSEVMLATWVSRMICCEIAFILVWSLLPSFVGMPPSEGLKLLLLFSILLMGAVSAVLSHPLASTVYGTTIPLVIAVFRLALNNYTTERWMIVCLSITALLLFVGLAKMLFKTTLETLVARAEKDDLFAEVEQTNMRLKEATKRAEDANAAKSKFLATMSHELRTPLNAILGFSEVIRGEMFGPVNNAQYKSYIEDIHQSGEHLLALINEVLDLSRIEAGKHELTEEAIDLVSSVEGCCHMLELRAKNRGVNIATNFTEHMPRLWADERAVRQVVLNLLSNAIKFTPQGAQIIVKVGWTASGGQYLSVKDNGPGIPENEIETVLSTFGRGSSAIKNADQGSGLGLPIVKSLVELHGGAFKLTSRVREGTEVIAMFPASRVMTPMAAISASNRSPYRSTTRAA